MNSISFFKALLMKELNEKDGAEFTKKYNDSPKLKGGQKNLPDQLQAQLVKKGMKKEDYKLGKEVDMKELERKIKYLKAKPENKGKKVSYGFVNGGKDYVIRIDGEIYTPEPVSLSKAASSMKEQDHEVSMAHNSLKSIVSSASQLMNLLGNDEKDIPAWIQDHITNAENFINQASKNYHEYSNGEHDMDELPDGTEELPAGDAEDLISLKDLMETVKNKKKRK